MAVVLLVLIPAHVGAALKHHFWDRHDVLQGMLPQIPDWEWNAYWRMDPRPDGRRVPPGPVISSIEQKFEHVGAGEAIAIVPFAPSYGRPDIVGVPITDAPPLHVVLATRAGENGRLVATFRKHAATLLLPERPPG